MSDTPSLRGAPYPAPAGTPFLWDSRHGAICPRCSTFIRSGSKVVRLHRPERPNTKDGRAAIRGPGKPVGDYYSDGREIRMQARWWVHQRCFEAGRQEPSTGDN